MLQMFDIHGSSFDANFNFDIQLEWILGNVRVPCIKTKEKALALCIQELNI